MFKGASEQPSSSKFCVLEGTKVLHWWQRRDSKEKSGAPDEARRNARSAEQRLTMGALIRALREDRVAGQAPLANSYHLKTPVFDGEEFTDFRDVAAVAEWLVPVML